MVTDICYKHLRIDGFTVTYDANKKECPVCQLQAKNERLKEVLKPFAEFSTLIDITRNATTITLHDFMEARQALKDIKDGKG